MAEQQTTLDLINRLANERYQLYRKSPMSEGDLRRVQQITQELEHLWDRLRRERAARRYEGQRPPAKDMFGRVS